MSNVWFCEAQYQKHTFKTLDIWGFFNRKLSLKPNTPKNSIVTVSKYPFEDDGII